MKKSEFYGEGYDPKLDGGRKPITEVQIEKKTKVQEIEDQLNAMIFEQLNNEEDS